jgi:DNA replication and repair protein RecF
LKLDSIELRGFRSYPKRSFDFDQAGNLVIGANGSGKTNLLEAIAYTSIGKSIRYHSDHELVQLGASAFALTGRYQTDQDSLLKVQLSYDSRRKILRINDELMRQLSELFARVKVIYCAPDDIGLINGSPRLRRQYFDMAISQIFPAYLGILRNYLHVVDQRNRLLKTSFQKEEKRVWDYRFAEVLYALYPYRKRYLKMLNAELEQSFASLSKDFAAVRVRYVGVISDALDQDESYLKTHIEAMENKEILWQRCLCGAHLDDYVFDLDGNSMRAFASQGQKRIAVIILKLIQAGLVKSQTGIKPILLYDDIFAELDHRHSERIRELSSRDYQIFVASPKEDIQEIWGSMKTIRLGDST